MEVERTDGELLLGIDVGTSHTKAVLVDANGCEVASASEPTPFGREDHEMAVGALLATIRTAIAQLHHDARANVAAVGLAGMAESGAPLDDAGRPLAPIIAWHDGRGEEQVARLERRFGEALSLRVGQPVRSVMTVVKLGWLVANGVTGAARWLGVPELVLHALTGEEATEFSLAARTGCYDVVTREWIPDVAADVGFAVDVFPPIAAAGSTMGRISRQAADAWGLPAGIPVTLAGHDHLAGMAGAALAGHDLANSLGTAETIVARAPEPPDMAEARARSVAVTLYPGGEEWALLVSAARAGIVLESAAELLGSSPAHLDARTSTPPAANFGALVDGLAHREPVTFPDTEPGAIWAGLLAALAARTAAACERLTAITDAHPHSRLVVFGGGSVSRPWLEFKQERLPLPVVASPVQSAVARGAAMYAGVVAGWWPSTDTAPLPAAVTS